MNTLSLLDEPFTFTQNLALSPRQFIEEAKKCGVRLNEQELEAWHRVRLLVPFFRVKRDTREAGAAYRRGVGAYHSAVRQPSSRAHLIEECVRGRLHDPASEPFIARRRLVRRVNDRTFESSVYLYSRHQLAGLHVLLRTHPCLKLKRVGNHHVGQLDAAANLVRTWREQSTRMRDAAVAATLLEPRYHSRIFGRVTLSSDDEIAAYDRWRRQWRLLHPLRVLDVKPSRIKETAETLHWEAYRIDPLGGWAEVIAAGEPMKWESLSGDARHALELRITAELLLLYYDDLHKARRAPALPTSPRLTRGPFDDRLRPRRRLNAMLTEFGLSPHPRLILAVEGETELVLFPRVMRQLGVPVGDDFIAVENARGAGSDLSPLVAYGVAPRLRDDRLAEPGRHVEFERPPTRLLVMFDAEKAFATAALRRERRDRWVERIVQTLPRDWRTPVVTLQLRQFVTVGTWTRTGASFEFAHFTDFEIARGVAALDDRVRQPTLEQRTATVAKLRAKRHNLDKMLHRISKVDLADELWPTLEAKIERALERGTERRIPIVRAVGQAYTLATEFPRRNVVLSIDK